MTEAFNAVWSALTTTNEELINILAIPCIFVESILNMLLFTTILKIDTTKKQKIIYNIVVPIISILSIFLIPLPFNKIINIIALPITVLIIFKTSILKAILSETIPMIISYVSETVLLKLYYLIFGITQNEAYSVPLYRFTFIFINYLIWFLLYKIFSKKSINITILDNMNKRTKTMLIVNSIFMVVAFALQAFMLSFYIDNLPIYVTIISLTVLVGYYIITFYSLIKTTKLQLTEQDLEQSQQYNKTLVILHDNIRCFRHDYTNMITTIGGYVQSEDMEGLKKYYKELLQDCSRVNSLSTLSPEVINNPAIYSLLTNKYHQATELGINITIESFLDFNNLNIKVYEFTKILGILLDNAIEAAKECENKIINVTIRNDFNVKRQLLIVENTYKDKNVDTEKIYEKGYTSKPNNTGLGLWETRQILKRHNNLNLYTSKDNEFFKQQLEIYL